jgi:NADH-quinone oxidoreductase subunit K
MTLFVALLATIGAYGLFHPKNILSFLMSVEIIILASTTSLVERIAVGDASLEASVGVFFMLVVAGAELAIGLALVMKAFKGRHSLCLESFNQLKE